VDAAVIDRNAIGTMAAKAAPQVIDIERSQTID